MINFMEMGYENITHWLSPGVYLLSYKGEIIYIGKSKNPLSRILTWSFTIKCDDVYLKFFRTSEEASREEKKMIDLLRPRLNVVNNADQQNRRKLARLVAKKCRNLTKGCPQMNTKMPQK